MDEPSFSQQLSGVYDAGAGDFNTYFGDVDDFFKDLDHKQPGIRSPDTLPGNSSQANALKPVQTLGTSDSVSLPDTDDELFVGDFAPSLDTPSNAFVGFRATAGSPAANANPAGGPNLLTMPQGNTICPGVLSLPQAPAAPSSFLSLPPSPPRPLVGFQPGSPKRSRDDHEQGHEVLSRPSPGKRLRTEAAHEGAPNRVALSQGSSPPQSVTDCQSMPLLNSGFPDSMYPVAQPSSYPVETAADSDKQPLLGQDPVCVPQIVNANTYGYSAPRAYPASQQVPPAARPQYAYPPQQQQQIPQHIAQQIQPQPYGYSQPEINLGQSYGAATPVGPTIPHPSDNSVPYYPSQFQTKKIRHKRGKDQSPSNDPKLFYSTLSSPKSWGPFQYNNLNSPEWSTRKLFSSEDLALFIQGPNNDGVAPSRSEPLTIWIQHTPAFEARRYADGTSICRWKECPVKRNTIQKGQFRVAFDECASRTGTLTDPYRVAGYMHLYCFEECFELFPLMVPDEKRFAIRPDTREFPFEETNSMALTDGMVDGLNAWSRRQNDVFYQCLRQNQPMSTVKEGRLWRALTEVVCTPTYIAKLAAQGRDIHVGTYMGDLEKMQALMDERLANQRHARAIVIDDDDDEGYYPRPLKRRPTTQRQRASAARRQNREECQEADDVDDGSPRRGQSNVRSQPPGKRPRINEAQVQREVEASARQAAKQHSIHHGNKVTRLLTDMVPKVGELPGYKLWQVQQTVSREADLVRDGVTRAHTSLPTSFPKDWS